MVCVSFACCTWIMRKLTASSVASDSSAFSVLYHHTQSRITLLTTSRGGPLQYYTQIVLRKLCSECVVHTDSTSSMCAQRWVDFHHTRWRDSTQPKNYGQNSFVSPNFIFMKSKGGRNPEGKKAILFKRDIAFEFCPFVQGRGFMNIWIHIPDMCTINLDIFQPPWLHNKMAGVFVYFSRNDK